MSTLHAHIRDTIGRTAGFAPVSLRTKPTRTFTRARRRLKSSKRLATDGSILGSPVTERAARSRAWRAFCERAAGTRRSSLPSRTIRRCSAPADRRFGDAAEPPGAARHAERVDVHTDIECSGRTDDLHVVCTAISRRAPFNCAFSTPASCVPTSCVPEPGCRLCAPRIDRWRLPACGSSPCGRSRCTTCRACAAHVRPCSSPSYRT